MKKIIIGLAIGAILASCNTTPALVIEYPYQEDVVLTRAQGISKITGYLTFDDFNDYTTKPQLDALLAVLAKHGEKGTFFVNCERLDKEPATLDWMRQIARAGHRIGNHSYSHFSEASFLQQNVLDNMRGDSNWENDKQLQSWYNQLLVMPKFQVYSWWYGLDAGYPKLVAEIAGCDATFAKANIAAYKKIFRPPYGEVGSILLSALAANGYVSPNIALWSVNSCDYADKTTTQEIVNSVLRGLTPSFCSENSTVSTGPFRNLGVVDFHLQGKNTAEALDKILSITQTEIDWKVYPFIK